MAHYYCRRCGSVMHPSNTKCLKCDSVGTLKYSAHGWEYYRDKSIEQFGDSSHWQQILIDEELKNDPLFEEELWETPESKEHYDARMNKLFNEMMAEKLAANNPNVPKCPTCGSTNIEKISAAKRGVHMGLFGVFSKTSFSQFKCKNCGYQW